MDACRRLFPFLRHVSAQLLVCKYQGSLFRGCGRIHEPPPAGRGISAEGWQCTGEGATGRGMGDRQPCRQHVVWADTRFPGGTILAVALLVSEGGRKVVGRGSWVRASGGSGFSAAGWSHLLPQACRPGAPSVWDYVSDGGVITLGTEPEQSGAVEAVGHLFAGLLASHWQQQQDPSPQE